MSDNYQIAVDGHSSCGKSTLAKDIALALNMMYIDSGAMYRAVSLFLIRNKISLDDKEMIARILPSVHIEFEHASEDLQTFMNGENVELAIRTAEVAAIVSPVAAIDIVREFLVSQQQQMGSYNSVVMDGRDIGTVVFPGADVKFFVTASLEVRSLRRWKELKEKNIEVPLEEIRDNLILRDEIDSNREHSPLTRADDAILIDNTELNRKEQLDLALNWITKLTGLKAAM